MLQALYYVLETVTRGSTQLRLASQLMIICLDDAQFHDESSWRFTLKVAEKLPGAFVLISARDDIDPVALTPFQEVTYRERFCWDLCLIDVFYMEQLLTMKGVSHMALGPLNASSLQQLAASIYKINAAAVPRSVVELLVEQTEGNPLIW